MFSFWVLEVEFLHSPLLFPLLGLAHSIRYWHPFLCHHSPNSSPSHCSSSHLFFHFTFLVSLLLSFLCHPLHLAWCMMFEAIPTIFERSNLTLIDRQFNAIKQAWASWKLKPTTCTARISPLRSTNRFRTSQELLYKTWKLATRFW